MKKELNLEFYKLFNNKDEKGICKITGIKIDDYLFDISTEKFDSIGKHEDDKDTTYIDQCVEICVEKLKHISEKLKISINDIEKLNIIITSKIDIDNGVYYLNIACHKLGIDYIDLYLYVEDDPLGYYICKLNTNDIFNLYNSIYLELVEGILKDSNYNNNVLYDENINASKYSYKTLFDMTNRRFEFIWHTMNVLSSYTVSCTINLIIPENIYNYLDEFGTAIDALDGHHINLYCINKSGEQKILELFL